MIRVVIADDQELVRSGLQLVLETRGCEVAGLAGDGREAVQVVRAVNPDVVLMDIRMPVMDGIAATRELTAANDTLRQVVAKLPNSRAAVHASAVLGAPKAGDGKILTVGADGQEKVTVVPAAPEEARALLSTALDDFDKAADALGHIGVADQTRRLAAVMADDGDTTARDDLLRGAADTLARRGVLPGVVRELRRQ